MSVLAATVGALLIAGVLWEAFETIVLPRRVTRWFRLTRVFYRSTWRPWSALACRLREGGQRENYLSIYGPLSLLLLIAAWAAALVVGFALLDLGLGAQVAAPEGSSGFGTLLYLSGTTFFTLGLGDVTPRAASSRAITVLEAGTGFAFLAMVISYLPVLYQGFSQREVEISLLDARAGSPPSGVELLRRHVEGQGAVGLEQLLHDWERWSAQLLESHLSFPVLAYYRSQHERESWLAALTAVLDACALVLAGVAEAPLEPARLTFAMARHAAVDLSQVFGQSPRQRQPERLSPADMPRLRSRLTESGVVLHEGEAVDQKLTKLRALYEPYLVALEGYLLMPLPPWIPPPSARDDWETSPGEPAGSHV